ncbi:MAG: hypothetical protein U0519_03625 [Candidatus Gracilibacteria bacterium]
MKSANVTGANQAYYAAEGALEKGLLVNLDKSAGYTTSSTAVFSKPPQSSYSIQGVVSDNSKQKYYDGYGIPSPGTVMLEPTVTLGIRSFPGISGTKLPNTNATVPERHQQLCKFDAKSIHATGESGKLVTP